MQSLIQFIYQFSDFTIILITTSALVISGLLVYGTCRVVFAPFRIKEDPYFGVTIIGTAVSVAAILLIFTLMQAMGIVSQTHKLVISEVEALYKVRSTCLLLSKNDCSTITDALDDYVKAVLASDWPKPPDLETQSHFEGVVMSLRDTIRRIPSDSVERQSLLLALDTMIKTRHERILNVGKEIPAVFYGATLCLLFSLVVFFYFLAPKTGFSQLVLALLLSFLGTLLGLVIVYDHPYEGDSGITQQEFRSSLEFLRKNR